MARLRALVGGAISLGGAFISSLCCVLPVAIVLLGLGSGAFMATTMRYTPVFVPVGVFSVTLGLYLHVRERRRCAREGCRIAGARWSLALLSLSALVVVAAVFFTVMPGLSSDLLTWATGSQEGPSTMDMPMGTTR